MAQSEGTCYINKLPNELLAKILDLVPIENVFADMRVSKRWEDVCRDAVRTRTLLIIGNDIRFIRYAEAGKMLGQEPAVPTTGQNHCSKRIAGADDDGEPEADEKCQTSACFSNRFPKRQGIHLQVVWLADAAGSGLRDQCDRR